MMSLIIIITICSLWLRRYTLLCFCWSPAVDERPRFTQMYVRLQEFYTSLAGFVQTHSLRPAHRLCRAAHLPIRAVLSLGGPNNNNNNNNNNETSFLFQRLSVLIERFNSALIMDSFYFCNEDPDLQPPVIFVFSFQILTPGIWGKNNNNNGSAKRKCGFFPQHHGNRVNCRCNHNFVMSSLVFLPAALCWWALKIIIIIIKVQRHKVVTSQALGQAVCQSVKGREEAWEKRDVFSLDLDTVTESQFSVVSCRQREQSIGMRASQKSLSWKVELDTASQWPIAGCGCLQFTPFS